MKSKKYIIKLIVVSIPIFVLLLYLSKDVFLELLPMIPACPFYTTLDLYCPACGNTRSTLALMDGQLGTSLRFNIVPILLLALSFLAYLELAFYAFSKPIRILPRKLSFYLVIIGLLIGYFILRNFSSYLTP